MAMIKYFKNIKYFLKKERALDKKYLFLIASKTKLDLDELSSSGLDFAGAIFPQIIYNNKLYSSGLIVFELNDTMQMLLIKKINEVTFSENEFSNCKSIVSIVEGISPYNETFLEQLFSHLDSNTNIIGGGAGFIQNECGGVIFDSDGFYYDSAILIKIKNDISMSAHHGCQYLKGPFVATSARNNVLDKIDYEDAFTVYKKYVEEDFNQELTLDNFSKIAKNYPLGIVKYNNEQIVRDPIEIKDGKLVLVGEIKDNTVINILKVDKDSMLNASSIAAKEAIQTDSNLVIMFDCLSRVRYLGESFDDELNNISRITKRRTTMGAVTIGEIANSGNRYINFFNKTCVIGAVWI